MSWGGLWDANKTKQDMKTKRKSFSGKLTMMSSWWMTTDNVICWFESESENTHTKGTEGRPHRIRNSTFIQILNATSNSFKKYSNGFDQPRVHFSRYSPEDNKLELYSHGLTWCYWNSSLTKMHFHFSELDFPQLGLIFNFFFRFFDWTEFDLYQFID